MVAQLPRNDFTSRKRLRYSTILSSRIFSRWRSTGWSVVVGAFHRLDRRVHRALRGEQQRRHVSALLLQRAHNPKPSSLGITRSVMTMAGRNEVIFSSALLAVASRLLQGIPSLNELFKTDTRGRVVLDDQHPFCDRIGGDGKSSSSVIFTL